MEIPVDDIELDKIPGAWVLTYWLGYGTDVCATLRLKIKHTSFEEPNSVEAEIRFGEYQPFIRVHAFETSVYEVSHADQFPDTWDDLPRVFTEEFKAMLRVWSALSELVSFGGTYAQRYANEPADSRDWYALNLDDSASENDTRH